MSHNYLVSISICYIMTKTMNNTENQYDNFFEKQFANKEYLEKPSGNIQTVEITPKHVKHTTPVYRPNM